MQSMRCALLPLLSVCRDICVVQSDAFVCVLRCFQCDASCDAIDQLSLDVSKDISKSSDCAALFTESLEKWDADDVCTLCFWLVCRTASDLCVVHRRFALLLYVSRTLAMPLLPSIDPLDDRPQSTESLKQQSMAPQNDRPQDTESSKLTHVKITHEPLSQDLSKNNDRLCSLLPSLEPHGKISQDVDGSLCRVYTDSSIAYYWYHEGKEIFIRMDLPTRPLLSAVFVATGRRSTATTRCTGSSITFCWFHWTEEGSHTNESIALSIDFLKPSSDRQTNIQRKEDVQHFVDFFLKRWSHTQNNYWHKDV